MRLIVIPAREWGGEGGGGLRDGEEEREKEEERERDSEGIANIKSPPALETTLIGYDSDGDSNNES